ncbi:MAG: GldM family protein [Saprospiraceae bacterium]
MLLLALLRVANAQPPVLQHHSPFRASAYNDFTAFDSDACLEGNDTIQVTAFYNNRSNTLQGKPTFTNPVELHKSGPNTYRFRAESIGTIHIILDFGNAVDTQRFSIRQVEYDLRLGRYNLDYARGISRAYFVNQQGLVAYLIGISACGKAKIIGFKLTRIRDSLPHQTVSNTGAKFSREGKALINRALPGDIYLFEDITLRVPGDGSRRRKHRTVAIRISE